MLKCLRIHSTTRFTPALSSSIHPNRLSLAALPLLMCAALGLLPVTVAAQAALTELSPAVGAETAAHVVRWTGALPEAAGKTIEVRFALYENAAGGLAIWSESQHVAVGTDGRYSVLLGATSNEGLPQTLFPAGQSRWVEAKAVNAAGKADSEAAIGSRSLLAAVPYAFKSVDAETLAGRAAADYLTREDLQQSVQSAIAAAPVQAPVRLSPEASPAIAGTGTTNALAFWTNSTTLGTSIVTEVGANVGVNTTAPATTLDVNGTATVRGSLVLPENGDATASAGTSSHSVQFGSSTYSSTSKAAVAQTFKFQAFPVGNDTTAPSSNLELLYAAGTGTPVATGLSFAANGRITFAPGQTFPVAAGGGTITGVTATSPLTGGGTTGAVTIGLNTTTLETTLNGKYAQLAAANSFTSSGTFAGPITGNSGSTMYAIQGNTSAGSGVQGYATGTGGWGVNGYATGKGGIGVYGNATGAPNGGTYPIGVQAHAVQGYGVKSTVDESAINYAAVLGQSNGGSGTYNNIHNDGTVSAGIWGDIGNNSGVPYSIGILGSNDNGWASYFANNSATFPTVELFNYNSSGSTGSLFKTLKAGSPQGTCGIGGGGNLSCTGQIKSLISTRAGERTVETYSMQSPENWMEDFGSGSLKRGSAVITIDANFAETVTNSADYRIFLTPNGDSKGLYVTNKTATSFEVRESGGGTASIDFDYRIVAKRRGYEAQRMTDVTEQFRAETKVALGSKGIKVSRESK